MIPGCLLQGVRGLRFMIPRKQLLRIYLTFHQSRYGVTNDTACFSIQISDYRSEYMSTYVRILMHVILVLYFPTSTVINSDCPLSKSQPSHLKPYNKAHQSQTPCPLSLDLVEEVQIPRHKKTLSFISIITFNTSNP